jgi:hypothetical protein
MNHLLFLLSRHSKKNRRWYQNEEVTGWKSSESLSEKNCISAHAKKGMDGVIRINCISSNKQKIK